MPITVQDFYPQTLHDDGRVDVMHLVQTLWIAAFLLFVRLIAELTVLKWMQRKFGNAKRAKSVFDNFYIATWSIAQEVLAIYVTLYLNGNCTPWSTDSCLTAWPKHPVHILQKWYMILMFQLYMHEMIGAIIGLGPRLKSDMVIHHFATMGLISTAYCLNLNRYGIMWQALFDTSNPILHAAKGLHAARVPALERIKWVLFNSFALVFFIARVATAPASILYPALTRAFDVLPDEWAIFLLALMAIVCGLQWIWFSRIVAVAMGKGSEGNNDDEEEDSKKVADEKKAQ